MTPDPRKLYSDRLASILLGLVAFGIYLSTLLPGVHHFGDTTKAQFLGELLGMTHPTGYPLYIGLTALWGQLPLGSLAFRINAFSAACGAGAVVFLFLLLRDRGVRPSLAILAGLAFCFSKMAWEQSVIAEVYALNVLLVGAVLFSLSRFDITKSPRWFLVACGLYSISFGNHLTMITLLPAFCFAVWFADRKVLYNWRLMAGMLLTIAIGAAQYYYLFARSRSDSLYLEYRVGDFEEFVEFISGERYRRSMFAFDWREVFVDRIPRFAGQLVRDLGIFAVLFPLALHNPGLSKGAASRFEPIRTTLLLAAAGQLVWVTGYDIPDIEVYLIPLAWCLAALSGLGLESLAGAWGVRARSMAPYLGAAVLLPLILYNQPDHQESAKFSKQTRQQLDVLSRDAALVNIVHYSPRMAYVYFMYAEGLAESRNLHLSYSTTPQKAAAYLRGKPALRDSHTNEKLPPGLSLYVDSRGARAERWHEAGLRLTKSRAGLRQVVLAGK